MDRWHAAMGRGARVERKALSWHVGRVTGLCCTQGEAFRLAVTMLTLLLLLLTLLLPVPMRMVTGDLQTTAARRTVWRPCCAA